MKDLERLLTNASKRLGKTECSGYLDNASKILGIKREVGESHSEKIARVVSEFESASGHSVTNLLRAMDVTSRLNYRSVVKDCCSYLKVDISEQSKVDTFERRLIEKLLEDVWDRLGQENPREQEKLRRRILKELEQQGDMDLVERLKGGAPLGILATASASGFGVYLGATTALGALSSSLGITLGFAAYTGLTRSISVAIGPVGWLLTGAYAVYKIGEPSYTKKIIPCVVLFTMLRSEMALPKTRRTKATH
jgi:uncharacterized protein YaaW (UPF0174 family)